jgi:hypothetical protein
VSSRPEKELEEFLAALPAATRTWLEQGAYMLSYEETVELENDSTTQKSNLRQEYERLLQPFPAKLREHRKRKEHERKLVIDVLMPLPLIPEGRPRKDALADEAAQLKEAGFSYAKIEQRINREHGEGTVTADSVRKLIKRLKSRQPAGIPDKT